MSPLTKTFVVLQVILSIALTAAVVVYVSREDAQLSRLKTAETDRDAARAESESARNAMVAATNSATAAQGQMNQQATQMNGAITAAQQQVADLNVQLAKASSTNVTQELEISRLSEGVKAALATIGTQNDTVTQLRTSSDEAVRRSAEMSASISDLTNRLDVTERERRNLAEQLAEATQQNQKIGNLLRDRGINPNDALAGGAAPRTAGIPINGVIRDTRQIAGVPYATISVGSADDVQRGMEFKVVQGDQFLGTVTVDAVEQNEASGRIAGPRVADIKPGVQVRTQY